MMSILRYWILTLLCASLFVGCSNGSSKLGDFNKCVYTPQYASG